MAGKKFEIVNGDISDGYHTFEELYDHRCLLFIVIVTSEDRRRDCYFLRSHFPGWDLLVWNSPFGQVSYHVSEKFRSLYESLVRRETEDAYQFDGHSAADVIERLKDNVRFRMMEARGE